MRTRQARWNPSLRVRLTLLVLVGVLPLLGFSLVEEYLDYRASVERTGHETLVVARGLVKAIDVELERRVNVLQGLATSNRLRIGEMEGFRRRAQFTTNRQFPGSNIVLLNEDGEQVMNLAATPGTKIPARSDVETIRKVFASGRPAISDLHFDAVLRRLVVSLDVPVLDEDGDVVAVLSMVPAPGTFDDLIRRHGHEPGSIVALFDSRHAVIARSPAPQDLIGQTAGTQLGSRMQRDPEGTTEVTSLEGVAVLAVFSRSRTYDWTISIGVPKSTLTAPSLASATRALAFAGLLLLVGLVLAFLVARRISTPIAALHALALATEGNAALPGVSTGLRETDRVADALRTAHERRLRSEQHFRTLFEANPLAMSVYDLKTFRLLEVNDAMVKLYGWTRAELLAKSLSDIWPPEDQWLLEHRLQQRQRGRFDLRQLRKDGSRFEAEAIVRVIELDGRRLGMSACQDITARRATEEQLRQAQKMETLGQLAGGVAHDFNNSLAVIMASVEDVLEEAEKDSTIHESAATALVATEQAAALTRRLLAFSRHQELAAKELDVAAVVGGLERMLRSSVGGTVELAVRKHAPGCRAVLDHTQLETSVMNLVVNARDAMNGSGKITVEAYRREIAEATASPPLRVGDWVVVSVEDDGQGMTEAVRARIFEPFFTTKEAGKGTGLGLSQIHGFVSQSAGFITVDSEVGAGTRIALHFPATG